MPSSTYVALASVKLDTAQTQITFNNIPQNYTDLILQGDVIGTTAYEVFIDFNGDDGTNYSETYFEGNGTVGSSARTSNSGNLAMSYSSSTNPTPTIMQIQNYSNNTTYKTILSRSSAASASVLGWVGLWRNTAAINSITLKISSGKVFSAGAIFSLYGIGANELKATGGDIITTDGTYWYHAFKTSGTFTPVSTLSCDVLVVAGGGGGGGYQSGGGGAGGVFYSTGNSLSTAQTVTVGAAGAGGSGNNRGSNGSNSVFGSLTAAVGGGGGGSFNVPAGLSGGSGGGAASSNNTSPPHSGGTGTAGQGNAGGAMSTYADPYKAGGGGGAGAAGSAGYTTSGNGGIGVNTYSTWLSTTGTGVRGYIAGGGGGGLYATSGGTPAVGGEGGGGNGNVIYGGLGTVGLPNTGGGGGGSDYGASGANAGSGLVIVRYAV